MSPMRVTDRLIAPSRGSVEQAVAYASAKRAERVTDVTRYLHEVYRLAPLVGIDPALVVAQSAHESGNWTSPAWSTRLNVAGIGITDWLDFGYAWANGADAARAQLVHLWLYAMPTLGEHTPDVLAPYVKLDPRWTAVPAHWRGSVRTIDDLTGKWATDPHYAAKIAAMGNAVFPGITDQGEEPPVAALVFGNVEHPPFIDRLIPDVQTGAWNNLGTRRALGVCQHSMVGSLWGTDGWFRRGRQSTGLTDYGVGNSTDGAQWDGVILRWNDPRGKAHTVTLDGKQQRVSANRAGWANGGSDGLEGDGPLFVRTLGIDAVNRDLVSIERSDGGDIRTPMSAKEFESICQLSAYWFDQAKVPWDRFPLNPAHGVVTHLLHLEFATKTCPHPPVTSRIDEIQNRVRAILKAGQTTVPGTEPVPVPAPVPPPVPVNPNHQWWPEAYTEAGLKDRFGTIRRHNLDGGISLVPFDPKGTISNAWVARGAAERIPMDRLPRPLGWWTLGGGEPGERWELVTFEENWTLFRAAANTAFRWIAAG